MAIEGFILLAYIKYITLKSKPHLRVQKFLMEASDMARWQVGTAVLPQWSQFNEAPEEKGRFNRGKHETEQIYVCTFEFQVFSYNSLKNASSPGFTFINKK